MALKFFPPIHANSIGKGLYIICWVGVAQIELVRTGQICNVIKAYYKWDSLSRLIRHFISSLSNPGGKLTLGMEI